MTITISNKRKIRQYQVTKKIRASLWTGTVLLLGIIFGTGIYIVALRSELAHLEKASIKAQPTPTNPEERKTLVTLVKKPPVDNLEIQRMLTAHIARLESQIEQLHKRSEQRPDTPPTSVSEHNNSNPLYSMMLSRKAQQYHLFSVFSLPQTNLYTGHLQEANTNTSVTRATQKKVAPPTVLRSPIRTVAKSAKVKKTSKTFGIASAKRKPASFLRTKTRSTASRIARHQLGKYYVWGAVGPRTFDCSGFTSYVYRKIGVNIPRTSRQQAQFGKLVQHSQLKPGDLVFFDTSRQRRGFVNHVGIYIGNNKFIHASSARHKVVISSLNKTFYRQRFKWGRRINRHTTKTN
jgi:cell wall-associated NlpC family hydrolase